jgi:hypothetical protein
MSHQTLQTAAQGFQNGDIVDPFHDTRQPDLAAGGAIAPPTARLRKALPSEEMKSRESFN